MIRDAIRQLRLMREAGLIGRIGYAVLLPTYLFAMLLAQVLFLLAMPFAFTWAAIAMARFERKNAVFADDGVRFCRAYGRRHVPWSEIAAVVRKREPKVEFYEIEGRSDHVPARSFIVSRMEDAPGFEAALAARRIPFQRVNWLGERDDAVDPEPPSSS